MRFDKQQWMLGQNGADLRAKSPNVLVKVLAIVVGGALLVVAFAISLFVLAAVLAGGLLLGGYFWWKTRALRKQIRERASERVFDGEIIEDVEFIDAGKRR